MSSEASLGAIARAKGGELLQRVPLNAAQRKVMRAMADCRSAAVTRANLRRERRVRERAIR